MKVDVTDVDGHSVAEVVEEGEKLTLAVALPQELGVCVLLGEEDAL